MKKTSRRYRLDWRDIGNGFIVAFIGGALTAARQGFAAGTFGLAELKTSLMLGMSSGTFYLVKNFFTDSYKIEK